VRSLTTVICFGGNTVVDLLRDSDNGFYIWLTNFDEKNCTAASDTQPVNPDRCNGCGDESTKCQAGLTELPSKG